MAETANIAKMAEKLSKDLFDVFGWHKTGGMDGNSPCCNKEKHDVLTHPADAVWYYDEPYANMRTYILADLKSYQKNSITPNSLQKAIVSLSKTIECAESSAEWKQKYFVNPTLASQVNGLLFIYNHDGEYDKDFWQQLKGVSAADVRFIPQNRSLTVLGPKDICELNTISNHIKTLGTDGRTNCKLQTSFFFPDLKLKKRTLPQGDPWENAAPLPRLTSKILSVKTRRDGADIPYDEFHIYYRGRGTSTEEFLHLIDYVFRFQQIQTASNGIFVHYVSLAKTPNAASFFDRAKNEYREMTGLKEEQLKKITFESVPNVVRQYSDVELGLEL